MDSDKDATPRIDDWLTEPIIQSIRDGVVMWDLCVVNKELEITYKYKEEQPWKVFRKLSIEDCGKLIGMLFMGTANYAREMQRITRILEQNTNPETLPSTPQAPLKDSSGIIIPFEKNVKK